MEKDKQNKTATFFVDESWIEIEGKKHLIIGAIYFKDPATAAFSMAEIKKDLGLKPFDEVKWNMKGLTHEQRIQLSDGVINLLNKAYCTALISIVEGGDKQKAAEYSCQQIRDYCFHQKIPAFILNVDQDLSPDLKALATFLETDSLDGPECIGLQGLDSSKDQLIQCCDIFTGLYRLVIWHELEGIRRVIKFFDDGAQEEIETELTDFIVLSTRYLIWGDATMTMKELEEGRQPFKRSMNMGFRLKSTISEDIKQNIEDSVATVYMGCLH